MSGSEFRQIMQNCGHTVRSLADRWGVSKSTVARECDRDEVRGLYRDAILLVAGSGTSLERGDAANPVK